MILRNSQTGVEVWLSLTDQTIWASWPCPEVNTRTSLRGGRWTNTRKLALDDFGIDLPETLPPARSEIPRSGTLPRQNERRDLKRFLPAHEVLPMTSCPRLRDSPALSFSPHPRGCRPLPRVHMNVLDRSASGHGVANFRQVAPSTCAGNSFQSTGKIR